MERSPRTTSALSVLAQVRYLAEAEGWSVADVTPAPKAPQEVPIDPSIGLSNPDLRLINYIARTPTTEEFFCSNDPQPLCRGEVVIVLSKPIAYLFRQFGNDLKYLAIPPVEALTKAVFQNFIRDE